MRTFWFSFAYPVLLTIDILLLEHNLGAPCWFIESSLLVIPLPARWFSVKVVQKSHFDTRPTPEGNPSALSLGAVGFNLVLPIFMTAPFLLGVWASTHSICCALTVSLWVFIGLLAIWWLEEKTFDFFFDNIKPVFLALGFLYAAAALSIYAIHIQSQVELGIAASAQRMVHSSIPKASPALVRSAQLQADKLTKGAGQTDVSKARSQETGSSALSSSAPYGANPADPSNQSPPKEDNQTGSSVPVGDPNTGLQEQSQLPALHSAPQEANQPASDPMIPPPRDQPLDPLSEIDGSNSQLEVHQQSATPAVRVTDFWDTPGTIFALFAATVTVLGFTITITRLEESHVRITSYDELLERLSRLLRITLDSHNSEGLRILCTVPTLGNMSRPDLSLDEVYPRLKAVIESNTLDVEIVCIDASLPKNIMWKDIQPDKGPHRYDIREFGTTTEKCETRRRLLSETGIGKFYDKTFGPRGFSEAKRLRGMVEAFDIFDHFDNYKSDGKCRCIFYPWENVTDSPPIHLFWTRKRAIVSVPVDRNVGDRDHGDNKVAMIGFETTDRNVIERLLTTYNEWKDEKESQMTRGTLRGPC